MPSDPHHTLERRLARLSADEMVAALALARGSASVRAVLRWAFASVSRPLANALARFDAGIDALGPSRAASGILEGLGVRWSRLGPVPPRRGPLLVVANHPGAYDALLLLAALGRDDVQILAADRAFLRAMPALSRHLILVPDVLAGQPVLAMRRAQGLRRAHAQLQNMGAIVHFGAGRIEPDPAFGVPDGRTGLAPWGPGTGALVRGCAAAGGAVVVALVEGVHSERAKRAWASRMAERRGVTTVAPLIQVAFRYYRAVVGRVRFDDATPATELASSGADGIIASKLRERALTLWPPSRADERPTERGDRVDPTR